jgi:hypothetical protein
MKFLRRLSIGLIALAFASGAHAADMAVKAAPKPIVYPTSACGLFYGFNVQGGAGAINNGPPGAVQIGGDIGGEVGYACPTASVPWFAQVELDFQNLNAGTAGFSLSGPAMVKGEVAIQTPLLAIYESIFNASSSQTPTVTTWLPPGYSVTGTPTNYIGLVTTLNDITAQYGAGSYKDWTWTPIGVRTGILFNVTGPKGVQVVADVFAELDSQSNQICFGSGVPVGASSCSKLGESWTAGIEFKL